jgi:hypothetical protein
MKILLKMDPKERFLDNLKKNIKFEYKSYKIK